MKLYDISRPISSAAVVYPGDEPLVHTLVRGGEPDCPWCLTRLQGWTTHVLTHIDFPRHFDAQGQSLDDMPLERFLCQAVVVEAHGEAVGADDVRAAGPLAGKAILFKTRNSRIPTDAAFDDRHVYVSEAAAYAIVEAGANLAGIDYLDIDRHGDDSYPAHRTLLGAGVLILEGLDLSAVTPGPYLLSALPLRIRAADGAPVRAVLIRAMTGH